MKQQGKSDLHNIRQGITSLHKQGCNDLLCSSIL